jgi:RNA polymerase sigma factor (sigma-70 family)
MVTPTARPLSRYIHRLALRLPPTGDTHLLERFVDHRDGEAFAALVRRHGPLVFAACRRILRDPHAAEDAFQLTFLVLARKAQSLRRPEGLGPWLYGVACRTALKARTGEARRRARERRAAVAPAVSDGDGPIWRDLRPVLDEAIARLPDRYRVPFVLHHLAGETVAEVARRLQCPSGTVAARLARARERLRVRLTRCGLTLSAATLAAALAGGAAPASAPLPLLAATSRVAGTSAASGVAIGSPLRVRLAAGGGKPVLSTVVAMSLLAATVGVFGFGEGSAAGERPGTGRAAGQRASSSGPEDDAAIFATASADFLRHHYLAADERFCRLTDRHPDSRLAPASRRLAILSKLLSTAPPDPDGRRAHEGERLIREAIAGTSPGRRPDEPPAPGEIDRRLRLAFGEKALVSPVKLWFRGSGLLIAADSFEINRDGSLRLTPCRLARFGTGRADDGDSAAELTVITGRELAIGFDRPVESLRDIGGRTPSSFEPSGDVRVTLPGVGVAPKCPGGRPRPRRPPRSGD